MTFGEFIRRKEFVLFVPYSFPNGSSDRFDVVTSLIIVLERGSEEYFNAINIEFN